MEEIKKFGRFINVDPNSRETGVEDGGVPIGANDLVQIQENARADALAMYEGYRQHMNPDTAGVGSSRTYDGVEYEGGLIISGMRYSMDLAKTQLTIEAGKMYLSGEVLDFPETVFNIAAGAFIWIYRNNTDDVIKEKRRFDDGNDKDVLITPIFRTKQTSLEFPDGDIATTDNHILFNAINYMSTDVRASVCEYFTLQGSGYMQQLRENYDSPVWVESTDRDTGFDTLDCKTRYSNRGTKLEVKVTLSENAANWVTGSWQGLADINQAVNSDISWLAMISDYEAAPHSVETIYLRFKDGKLQYLLKAIPAGATQLSCFSDYTVHSISSTENGRIGESLWMKHPDDPNS